MAIYVKSKGKTINGNVTGNISFYSSGQVSGFSSTSWIILPNMFSPASYPWEMVFHFNIDNFDDTGKIISGNKLAWQNIDISINTNRKVSFYSYSNNSSSLLFQIEGSTILEVDKHYWIKCAYNPEVGYSFYLSTDGTDYKLEASSSVKTPITNQGNDIALGGDILNDVYEGRYFRGSIFLQDSYININGMRWWNGLIDKNKLIKNIYVKSSTYGLKEREVIQVNKGRKNLYLKEINLEGATGGTVSGVNFWAGSGGSRYNGSATGTITYGQSYSAGNWDISYRVWRQRNTSLLLTVTVNYEDGTNEKVIDAKSFDTDEEGHTEITTIRMAKRWKSYTVYYATSAWSNSYCYAGISHVYNLKWKGL